MTKHRVRVPQVADISAAIRLYYEHTEIGNKDIRAIFGDMGNGRYCGLLWGRWHFSRCVQMVACWRRPLQILILIL